MTRPALRVEVEGLAELRRTMRRAAQDLGELKEVNAEAAEVILDSARRRVPRRSGRLASTLRSSGTKSAAVVRAGFKSVPYAPVVHFGWPEHGIEPQPFLTDAVDDTEREWRDLYRRAIARIMGRIRGA